MGNKQKKKIEAYSSEFIVMHFLQRLQYFLDKKKTNL